MRKTRRPALAGAGEWTHQYHDPGNTICGTDRLVTAPLALLWFGSPDIRLPNRHGRGPAPLYASGRMFVEGVDGVRALDAYNGRLLWQHLLPGILKPYHQEHIMGAAGTGSNLCLGGGSVFVHVGAKCLKLDQATGKQIAAFDAPPLPDGSPGRWSYVAYADKTLFASLADEKHLVPYRFGRSNMGGMFTESRAMLALDPATGKVRWRYDAKESIRNNAIAIAGGKVFLIDRAKALETPGRRGLAKPQPTGVLLALDAGSGKVLWRNEKDVYGTMLAASAAHGVLLMCYQDTRFKLNSELGGRMTGLKASTGTRLWEAEFRYASRPLINGQTVYAQPHAWDLLTGKQKTVRDAKAKTDKPWTFARSYGCGTISASTNLLLFRSATLGYRDLLSDRATANYGGVRPGCWINVIPAGGLVLMPDATTGCRCSYLNRTTIALQPRGAWPPKIQPEGGAFRKPVKVTLQAPPAPEAGEIRYTLDGSTPTSQSPAYKQAVTVDRTATLKARLFRRGSPAGEVASARFTVDRHILSPGESAWRIWDAPKAVSGPSRWTHEGDTITQHSNIFTGSSGAATPQRVRYGTMRIFRDGKAFGDGELTLEIRSQDDDMLGVAFRCQSAEKHYLWAMDAQRSQHVLACRNGQDYTVLASNKKGYTRGRWHKVRIVLAGGKIAVYLDGQKDLEAADATFPTGTIALHVWGNSGSSFRGVRWAPARAGR
jgi:outer membrane protein assembly factor BamB